MLTKANLLNDLTEYLNQIIHAFEPNNYECEKLKSKFKDHHNIIINNVGLGDKEK